MTSPAAEPLTELSLPIVGMTCASCVTRIERFLGRTDGVADAAVNLATERATVHFDAGRIDHEGIVAAIEAAGYEVAAECVPHRVQQLVARREVAATGVATHAP